VRDRMSDRVRNMDHPAVLRRDSSGIAGRLHQRSLRSLSRLPDVPDHSPSSTWERSSSRSAVLVDAGWVEAHLDTSGVGIVQLDQDTTAYDKGHIRGAIKLDWKKDLQDPVRRDFIDKAGFEALLSERGIANDDTVVLYGG